MASFKKVPFGGYHRQEVTHHIDLMQLKQEQEERLLSWKVEELERSSKEKERSLKRINDRIRFLEGELKRLDRIKAIQKALEKSC